MEFKGTKGIWELIEHNWSDSSIMCGDKTIATNSIYEEATEANQEVLEAEMSANMKLISCAPEMLEMLKEAMDMLYRCQSPSTATTMLGREIEQLIKKATTV